MPENLFEPTVMFFFRMTNLLVIFQAMMNNPLWDLINIEKIVSFINDVMTKTKEEEEYDKLVEKLLKKIKEINLYIKLEKQGFQKQ